MWGLDHRTATLSLAREGGAADDILSYLKKRWGKSAPGLADVQAWISQARPGQVRNHTGGAAAAEDNSDGQQQQPRREPCIMRRKRRRRVVVGPRKKVQSRPQVFRNKVRSTPPYV